MKKKLLFVSHYYKIGGGTSKFIYEISSSFEDDIDMSIINFYNEENCYPFEGDVYKFNEKSLSKRSFFTKFFYLIKRAYLIAKISRDNNIDIIFAISEETSFSVILSKIFLCKSKMIISHHCNIISYNLNFKILIFLLDRFADKITVLGSFQKNILASKYFIKKELIHIIPNFIDEQEINNGIKNEIISKDESKFTSLHIGRLASEKQQIFLLDSFDIFYSKYPNSQLLILGDGPLKTNILEKIETLPSKYNITLLGIDPNPFKYFNISDCFLLCSNQEGMPIVLLESQCCGVPIIATDCKTGPRDILSNKSRDEKIKGFTQEEYGILVEQNNNPDLFASAMEKMYLNKELREEYIIKGKQRIKDFSKEIIMKQWIDLFNSL